MPKSKKYKKVIEKFTGKDGSFPHKRRTSF